MKTPQRGEVWLVVFTLAILSALLRGLDITCGCFTQDPEAATIGWFKIAENLGFLVVGVWLLLAGEGRFSLQHYLTKRASANE